MAILGQNFVDLSPLFNLNPTRNSLLASLGLFDGVGVSSHKVAVSRLVEDNHSLYNEPTARFSSEHNVTARQNGKEYLIELPYFLREDQITPADIQGKRKPGTDVQETLTDVYAAFTQKHSVAFMRTRESYLARCLFSGTVHTPKTDDVLIDFGALFGVTPMNTTLNLTATDSSTLRAIDDMVSQISEAAQGMAAQVERIIVFAKGDFYSNLRFSPAMEAAFRYVSPLDESNVVYQRRDLLPGISTFSIPGSNVDVVKVTDPLLLAQMGDADAIAIPQFATGSMVYQNIYGAPSSSFELLDAAAAETYSWSYESERGDVVNVISENSSLPVNHGLGFSVHITAA
ncbi:MULTISPECIES: major capsid protein [Enterobacter]|uniref:major capsid protein n=1 Tax=Enterobacter TaxID=547 RepID=UPI000682587D|nr:MULTISPECIES: major capsid protein [Enterobacter]EKU2857282.1 major capsid protein [Enterobacter roggenkampii]MBX8837291.1 phage capsid protein [Enterobacter sp. Y17]MCU6359429.1 major capsid protein [Enterobacter quasiroggenkampii]